MNWIEVLERSRERDRRLKERAERAKEKWGGIAGKNEGEGVGAGEDEDEDEEMSEGPDTQSQNPLPRLPDHLFAVAAASRKALTSPSISDGRKRPSKRRRRTEKDFSPASSTSTMPLPARAYLGAVGSGGESARGREIRVRRSRRSSSLKLRAFRFSACFGVELCCGVALQRLNDGAATWDP